MKLIGRVIFCAILLLVTGVLLALAAAVPDFLMLQYQAFSGMALQAIGTVTNQIPFALWEALALILLLFGVYSLIRAIAKKRILRWLAGVLELASILALVFTALWGLNHFAPTVEEKIGLPVREYSAQELASATAYYAAQAGQFGASISRDANGLGEFSDFSVIAGQAADGYAVLGKTYDVFEGENPTVKKLAAWPLYSRFGMTGYYICFTAEASVNPDTYRAWLPFTMCHEIAHQKLIAQEDGANFCAYLACMENENPQFRYSGAMAAFVYCSNALSKTDPQAFAQIWQTLDPGLRADLDAANAHYEQYEGSVQDAAQTVTDAYLKTFSEKSGVQSYGEAADLLIAWYLQNNA